MFNPLPACEACQFIWSEKRHLSVNWFENVVISSTQTHRISLNSLHAQWTDASLKKNRFNVYLVRFVTCIENTSFDTFSWSVKEFTTYVIIILIEITLFQIDAKDSFRTSSFISKIAQNVFNINKNFSNWKNNNNFHNKHYMRQQLKTTTIETITLNNNNNRNNKKTNSKSNNDLNAITYPWSFRTLETITITFWLAISIFTSSTLKTRF